MGNGVLHGAGDELFAEAATAERFGHNGVRDVDMFFTRAFIRQIGLNAANNNAVSLAIWVVRGGGRVGHAVSFERHMARGRGGRQALYLFKLANLA